MRHLLLHAVEQRISDMVDGIGTQVVSVKEEDAVCPFFSPFTQVLIMLLIIGTLTLVVVTICAVLVCFILGVRMYHYQQNISALSESGSPAPLIATIEETPSVPPSSIGSGMHRVRRLTETTVHSSTATTTN